MKSRVCTKQMQLFTFFFLFKSTLVELHFLTVLNYIQVVNFSIFFFISIIMTRYGIRVNFLWEKLIDNIILNLLPLSI